MSEVTLAISIITAITSIATATVLVFTYHQDLKRDRPQFLLTAIYAGHPPNRKPIGVQINTPTKPIEHCQVLCNGIPLGTQFGVNMTDWAYVGAGSNVEFYFPKDLTNVYDASIVVKNGKSKIYPETKVKELLYVM